MWKRRCRTCRVDGIWRQSPEQFPELQPIELWKYGKLIQCVNCHTYWFQHEDQQRLSRIEEALLPLARHWNTGQFKPDDSILRELARIGGIVDYGKEIIRIPCAIQNTSGQHHDKALIIVSKQPPCFWYKPETIHWANEIATLNASPYALPFEVRRTVEYAPEISMAYAPTVVKNRHGTSYTVSRGTTFFDKDGIKGEEIKLSDYRGEWREEYGWEYGLLICMTAFIAHQVTACIAPHKLLPKRPKTVWPEPTHAYYFVDWFDGCEELLTAPSTNTLLRDELTNPSSPANRQ